MIDVTDVPYRPVPDLRSAGDKEMLRELVRGSRTGRSRLRRPRFLIVVGVTVVGLTGASTALAISLLQPRAATVHDAARCYARVTTDAGSDFPGTTFGFAPTPGETAADTAAAAIDVCQGLWARGFLTSQGYGAPNVPDGPDGLPPADQPVPALTVCVLKDGEAAVFPGDASTCASLNLPSMAG